MTPVFCCGFECGISSGTGHWGTLSGASFSVSTVRSGARSLRILPGGSTTIAQLTGVTLTNKTIVRFYLQFSSMPNISCELLRFDTSTKWMGIVFSQSDSKLYTMSQDATTLVVATDSAAGVSVTTGVWYRIDYYLDASANPRTQKLSVDGTEVTSSNANAASTPTTLNLGPRNTSCTFSAFVDDFILSQTLADYPIGAGFVNHFVPTSDGTHTCISTNILEGTIAAPTGGAAITSATTDAFNWVNGVPLLGGATDNTRLINQQTVDTGYVEVVFGPAPGISIPTTAPRAVEVITADREATTATGNFITRLNDNGTTGDIVNRGTVAGVVSDRYATKQFATPPTGGAWTVVSGAGNFKNIRARFGFSSDATPDQYWRGIMIEAEFAPIVVTEIPNKIIQVGQAVNRASTY